MIENLMSHRHKFTPKHPKVIGEYQKGNRESVLIIGDYQECNCGEGLLIPLNPQYLPVPCKMETPTHDFR